MSYVKVKTLNLIEIRKKTKEFKLKNSLKR